MNNCQNRIHKANVENPQLKSQAVTLHVCGFDMITDVVSMSVCDEYVESGGESVRHISLASDGNETSGNRIPHRRMVHKHGRSDRLRGELHASG